MCPTLADGISWVIPSTMPSPARRMGTRVSFLPATCLPVVRSSGVSISTGAVGRSLVTSYAIRVAISLTSCLKSRVLVSLSRRIESLCWMRGCDRTVRLGKDGGGMEGKYDSGSAPCHPEPKAKGVKLLAASGLLGSSRALPYISRPYGQVAQLVEQRTENPRVGGSIPSLAIHKGLPHRCKLFAFAFVSA